MSGHTNILNKQRKQKSKQTHTNGHTPHRNVDLKLFLLVCLHGTLSLTALKVQPLKEGLAVTKAGPVHIERGKWQIVMAIETPTYPDLPGHVQAVKDFLGGLPESRRAAIGPVVYSWWLTCLANIHASPQSPVIERSKRSLLPFMGELASQLFGTANEHQVADL